MFEKTPEKEKICPVSGLVISERPEWTLGKPDDSYRGRFSLIGDRIIYSRPSGSASSANTRHSLDLNEAVEKFVLSANPSYVLIENFSDLKEFTADARLTYIRYFHNRPGICGLIFFGVPYLTSLSIRIAAKMYLASFPVKVVSSYEEAVRLALGFLKQGQEETRMRPPTDPESPGPGPAPLRESVLPEGFKIQTDSSWAIRREGYSARYEIINGHIIHSVGQGYFGRPEIIPVIEMQEKLFLLLDPGRNDYHMIADISGITGISYHTRLLYTRAQRDFYARHRFDSLIFYGGSKILKAAVYFGRSFVPFKTILTDSFSESLDLIYKNRPLPGRAEIEGQNSAFGLQKTIDEYSSDVLKYLGTLNLDVDAQALESISFPKGHPFQKVFDTIDLINDDLNEIALQRRAGEEKRRELEKKLALAEKMESLGRLSGGIAHDFNNILSGMMGYCELAKNQIHHPDIVLDKIEQIHKGAKRAADLVKQILLFSRNTRYEKTVYELGLVVAEAMKLLKPTIPSTIKVVENLKTRKKVLADPAKMHQIMMNLVTNAYQAMDAAGGTLSVALNDAEIKESEDNDFQIRPGHYLRLEVSDTGSGMAPEVLERIFEPYFTTKEVGKGTGMGLSLVYTIVEEHEGYIKADSKPGQGSVFTVYLPEAEVADEIKEPEDSFLKASGGHETIMIVDDEKSILDSTGELLQDSGYRVEAYDSPLQALSAFEKNPFLFDLVVTDMTMPGMTGDVLAKKMMETRPSIPIILCSGYTDRLSGTEASESGICRFLQKPIIDQPLSEVIREVLDGGSVK